MAGAVTTAREAAISTPPPASCSRATARSPTFRSRPATRCGDGVAVLLPDSSARRDAPAALGNRIAAAVIEYGSNDGALENERYVDSSYTPANDPLLMSESGTVMADPNRGSRWRSRNRSPRTGCRSRRVSRSTSAALGPCDAVRDRRPAGKSACRSIRVRRLASTTPMAAPHSSSQAVEVIRRSSQLRRVRWRQVDISPGSMNGNSLGTNDGDGHDVNPVTGQAYPRNFVLRGDYVRTLAAFWADGPRSETPPGHWNTLANDVTTRPASAAASEGPATSSTRSSGT